MRRMEIEAAFGGDEPARPAAAEAGDEALALEVHGGEVLLLVPAGTGDEAAVARSRLIRGTLHLENERSLTFEIGRGEGVGSYGDEPLSLLPEQRAARAAGERREGARPPADPRATAADIMTREVLTTRPSVPVKELAKRLAYHRISGMPVVDDQGAVLGIVSEADLISKRGATVAEIMTTPVLGVEETTPAVEVAALLTEERIKRVPVLRAGRLVGLIGRSNVVSWVAGQGAAAGDG